jgi:superfamily II DNA or RNA helicase
MGDASDVDIMDIMDAMDAIWDKMDAVDAISESIQQPRLKKKLDVSIAINISRKGTYMDVGSMPYEIIKKIKNYYTIKNKTIMGYIATTANWSMEGNKLYIPRFGAFLLRNKFADVVIENSIVAANPVDLEYEGKFAGNQELIFNEIVSNHYNSDMVGAGRAGLILNLQAGMGKTFLAMSLINHLQCRTLIVVHNKGMLQQWDTVLTQYFPKTKLGFYYGTRKTRGDILVGVINSLVSDDLVGYSSPAEFYAQFDFVIFDEAHEYCSPMRSKIYRRCQSPYTLGLSATPQEREDGLDKINMWGIGPILVAASLDGYTEADIPFKGNVIQVRYLGPDKYTQLLTNEKLELMSAPLMIGQLTEDEFRLRMIADLIMEQHIKNYNIFVFADRRDYLTKIEEEIKQLSLKSHYLTNDEEAKALNKIESIRLVGGSTSQDMEAAKNEKTIILATYQYMATGTSIPKMNAIVLATPRKSKSRQIIGRVFRFGSDYSIVRQIVDVVDWKTGLKNQWYKRKKYYDEQGYPIEVRQISYMDIRGK